MGLAARNAGRPDEAVVQLTPEHADEVAPLYAESYPMSRRRQSLGSALPALKRCLKAAA
jgi:hypothetical protein